MDVEKERAIYLIELANIIEEEKLSPEQATQLMSAEIASWLMVISKQLTTLNILSTPKAYITHPSTEV